MKPVFLAVGAAWLLAAVPAAPHHAFAAEFAIANVQGFGARDGTNTANAAPVTLASTGELPWARIARN